MDTDFVMDTVNPSDTATFLEAINSDTDTPAPKDVRVADQPEKVPTEVLDEATKDETASSDTPADKAETEKKVEEPRADARAQPDPDAEAAKQKSKYAKEMARREKSWQTLADEKAALDKRQQEFATKEADLQRRQQEVEVKAQTPTYSPEQYDKAAEKFEAEGKFDLAEEAKAAGADLRANPPDARARAASERQSFLAENQKAWNEVQSDKRYAALADKTSDMQKEALKLFPWIGESNQGNHPIWKLASAPKLIAEYMTHKLASARVPELEKSLKAAESQIAELKKLTAVPVGGSVHSKSQPKSISEMTEAEQEDAMLQLAANGESIFGGRGF